MGLQQRAGRLVPKQRRVAGEDDKVSAEALKPLSRLKHGVARPELAFLDDGSGGRPALAEGGDLVSIGADDDHRLGRLQGRRCLEHVCQHGPAAEREEHLGALRAQPGPFSGGENYNCGSWHPTRSSPRGGKWAPYIHIAATMT